MAIKVSVTTFVQEMHSFSDEITTYLNRKTGEFLSVMHDEFDEAEALEDEEGDDDGDADDVGDDDAFLASSTLHRDDERLAKVREVISSDDWLSLPSKYEIHEYEIMRDFCEAVTDSMLQADLLDAIHGSGAFSRFKGMLGRRNMLDKWYAYRDEAYREIARDWLESNEIPFTD